MTVHKQAVPTLAVLLAVLTVASSASAECAWMLWVETAGPVRLAAFDSRSDCLKTAKQRVEHMVYGHDRKDIFQQDNSWYSRSAKAGPFIYSCWPESVDLSAGR